MCHSFSKSLSCQGASAIHRKIIDPHKANTLATNFKSQPVNISKCVSLIIIRVLRLKKSFPKSREELSK